MPGFGAATLASLLARFLTDIDMTFTVLTPARYASTRLPGKPLADIDGKPMIVRVAERALASGAAVSRSLGRGASRVTESGLDRAFGGSCQ